MKLGKVVAIGLVLAGLSVAPAQASVVAGLYDGPGSWGDGGLLVGSDFSLIGTKWEPGGVAATNAGGGIPSPGGANWSIMGPGLDVDPSVPAVIGEAAGHPGTTVAFTTLGVTGWVLADYIAALDAAFNVWSAAADIDNLGLVADGGGDAGAAGAAGGTGNIRFAAWDILAAGVLAHAFNPCDAALCDPGGNIGGDTHFDLSFDWEDDPTDVGGDPDFDFFTVALHEIGHALGLGHSAVLGSVMEPVYAGARRSLSADDIAGIRALYGEQAVIPEPTSLLLLATGLGVVAYARRKRTR